MQKKNLYPKICFFGLEKAYVQLFVLNFFLSRSWKTSKNRPNSSKLPKIIFCRPKSEKKFKTKSCTYTFSSPKKQILVKKKKIENFFLDFFQFFFQKMGKSALSPNKNFCFNIFLT